MEIEVENMIGRSGNSVPNQFIIHTKDGDYFQSYNKIIVFAPYKGKIQLDENVWDYSKTTGKYRNKFLGINKRDILRFIKNGTFELVNLNKSDE